MEGQKAILHLQNQEAAEARLTAGQAPQAEAKATLHPQEVVRLHPEAPDQAVEVQEVLHPDHQVEEDNSLFM